MGLGGRANWEAPLHSVPRIPNHSSCEMGELTQTGEPRRRPPPPPPPGGHVNPPYTLTHRCNCLPSSPGVVQHLHNGQLLRQAYSHHGILPSDWSPRQLGVETTSRSRTVQSGLAFLYGFLPDFDWGRVSVRHQWSTLFCGAACDCPARSRYLEEEQRRQYRLRAADGELEKTYGQMARAVGVPTRQLRAANPVDSLLCHLCHGLPFPCTAAAGGDGGGGGCLTMEQFAVIRRQQRDDELDRGRAGLYRKYAVLAMHPYLNQTAARMVRASRDGARREEVFSLASGHDITISPLLSALGLSDGPFPRFAARVVFELWRSPPAKAKRGGGSKGKEAALFVRVLYNGEDVTFRTAFCRSHDRHAGQPLCPLRNFLSFVRRDMFSAVNATSYQEACSRR